jgi:hypothetical protein
MPAAPGSATHEELQAAIEAREQAEYEADKAEWSEEAGATA